MVGEGIGGFGMQRRRVAWNCPVVIEVRVDQGGVNAAKLLRACGGCLGARRRRRAWKTAISPAELSNER